MSSKEEKVLISVSRLRNSLFRDLDGIFRANGLTTTQFAVLEVLLNKGGLCVKEIQEYILGTNGNVPLVVKNLERDGLVSKHKLKEDARFSIIELTEEGRELVSKVYPLQKERLKVLLSLVNENEIDLLTKLLFDTNEKVEEAKIQG